MGTHTHKTNGRRWGIGFLSSTQQHTQQHSAVLTICNQFQGFLIFSRVRDEKGENETNKNAKSIQTIWKKMKSGQNNRKTHTKQMEKGWELDFPAALSSTQQCSICNQFQGFLTFCRVRGEKGENEAKKKRKIHQRIGKNNVGKHTKQMEKGLGLYF